MFTLMLSQSTQERPKTENNFAQQLPELKHKKKDRRSLLYDDGIVDRWKEKDSLKASLSLWFILIRIREWIGPLDQMPVFSYRFELEHFPPCFVSL